jgi:uncharacterized membrane protein YidH (DUF202 family)
MDIRIGGLLQPAWTRTATAFAGTTSAVTGKLQPAITRTAAISSTIFEEATNLVGAFLTPAAVLASVMGIWRLGADLGLTGDFIVSTGLFSHWLVWMMLALVLKMTGSLIHRVAEPTDPEAD